MGELEKLREEWEQHKEHNCAKADALIAALEERVRELEEQYKSDETIIATLRDMEIEATELADKAEAALAVKQDALDVSKAAMSVTAEHCRGLKSALAEVEEQLVTVTSRLREELAAEVAKRERAEWERDDLIEELSLTTKATEEGIKRDLAARFEQKKMQERCATCLYLDSENDDTWVCLCPEPSPLGGEELMDPQLTWCARYEKEHTP